MNSAKRKKSGGAGYLLVGAGTAAWWLSKEENRAKFDGWVSAAKSKLQGSPASGEPASPAEKKAANPVEEGTQFSVDYFNKKNQ